MRQLVTLFFVIFFSACAPSFLVSVKIDNFNIDPISKNISLNVIEETEDNLSSGLELLIQSQDGFSKRAIFDQPLKNGFNTIHLDYFIFDKMDSPFKFALDPNPTSYIVNYKYFPNGKESVNRFSSKYFDNLKIVEIGDFEAWNTRIIFSEQIKKLKNEFEYSIPETKLILDVVDAETLIPLNSSITNCKLVINEIFPQKKPTFSIDDMKQNLLKENYQSDPLFDEIIMDVLVRNKYNLKERKVKDVKLHKAYSPTITRENNEAISRFIIEFQRLDQQYRFLDLLVRAEGYQFFEGKISYEVGVTNKYLIKLPKLGTKIRIDNSEPLNATIEKI